MLRWVGGMPPAPRAGTPLATHPEVRTALARRNAGLSSFWLAAPAPVRARRTGRVLVVDAEDLFTGMLGHQLRALGHDVTVRTVAEATEGGYDTGADDTVVLGPGPGDPRDRADPRIAGMYDLVAHLLDRRVPFVAECLSHQVLCAVLGLPLHERERPNQGTQQRIDLFGTQELVGFYNSYAAAPAALPAVELCHADGEVHAVRGEGFASTQFHMESVLTRRGPEILARLLSWAAEKEAL
jgi:phenazine biosynthesis protein phzE